MRSLAYLRSFVGRIFNRQRVDNDLDEEIRSQIELMADQKMKEGMTPARMQRSVD